MTGLFSGCVEAIDWAFYGGLWETKVTGRGDERDDTSQRITVRRIKDRTFIGGTSLYSRFQRGGRECGYKDVGREHNEVERPVWQVVVASRLITAM